MSVSNFLKQAQSIYYVMPGIERSYENYKLYFKWKLFKNCEIYNKKVIRFVKAQSCPMKCTKIGK